MNVLVVLGLVAGGFALGVALGRESVHVRRGSGRSEKPVSRLTRPSAKPTLRVITGGRARRSAGG